jgi:DNA-binding GntR family transcriptional regulator
MTTKQSDTPNILVPQPKRSLSDDILQQLREAIFRGELAPNERLREELLAEKLGVSRGPIREALTELEREGLVIKLPNGRAIVARLSLEDLNEVYSLRLAIEQLAVRRAAQYADPAVLQQMQVVVDEIADVVAKGITEQDAARLDIEFHDLIYKASAHKRLYKVWSNLRPQVHVLLLNRYVAKDDFKEYISVEHQSILNAIRNHDESRAVIMIVEHLTGGYTRVLKSYMQREQEDKQE